MFAERFGLSSPVTAASHRTALVGVVLSIVACNARRPETAASGSNAGIAAEVAVNALAEHEVLAAEGAVELRVRASAPPVLRITADADEGARTDFEADLAAGEKLSCSVMSGWTGIAHAIETYVAQRRYEMLDRPHIEVDAVAGRPILLFDLQSYSYPAAGPTIFYGWLAGAYLDEASVVCVYAGANPTLFRGLMRQLVRSAREPKVAPASFRSISMTSSAGRPLGFEYVRLYRDKRTSRSRVVSLSSEILSWERQWTSADGITTIVLDEHDAVVEEQRVLEVGKSTQLDTTLQRTGPSSYEAHGLVFGRTKREKFESSMPLTTPLSRAPKLAAFVRGELSELSSATFDALRPGGPVLLRFERAGGRQVRQVDRGKTIGCDVDERGLCARMWNDADGWSAQLLDASGTLE